MKMQLRWRKTLATVAAGLALLPAVGAGPQDASSLGNAAITPVGAERKVRPGIPDEDRDQQEADQAEERAASEH